MPYQVAHEFHHQWFNSAALVITSVLLTTLLCDHGYSSILSIHPMYFASRSFQWLQLYLCCCATFLAFLLSCVRNWIHHTYITILCRCDRNRIHRTYITILYRHVIIVCIVCALPPNGYFTNIFLLSSLCQTWYQTFVFFGGLGFKPL